MSAGNIRDETEGWEPFAWKHNALRHFFINYRLAAVPNTAQVALEAGKSPQMIFGHYRELVRAMRRKSGSGSRLRPWKRLKRPGRAGRRARL